MKIFELSRGLSGPPAAGSTAAELAVYVGLAALMLLVWITSVGVIEDLLMLRYLQSLPAVSNSERIMSPFE
jgi:hypothetical protein